MITLKTLIGLLYISEYGMGSEVSIEGDMYSFGILVLEILTGRRPTDEIFKDGHNLHNHVKFSISNNLLQIVDPTILPKELKQASNYPVNSKGLLAVKSLALCIQMQRNVYFHFLGLHLLAQWNHQRKE